MYAMFVLLPLVLSIQYSFFRWDGIGPATWVGLKNYATVLSDPSSLGTIFNAFRLVVFFSFIPVALGLVTAQRHPPGRAGRLGTVARTVLFLPQVIPLVAAGIIWGWLLALTGLVNQLLTAIGLGDSRVPGSATSTWRSRPLVSSGSGSCSDSARSCC